jgi:hypothetical protein
MKYSWFYFDLLTEDGVMIVIIFHGHPYFLTFDISILDICIYQEDKRKQFGYSQPAIDSVFEKIPLKVKISGSQLVGLNDHYLINIDEKDVQMQFELKPIYKHWKSVEIPLYKSKKYYFMWQIYSPSLRVSGFYSLNGKKINVNGNGYLDYNEGNYLFNKFLKSWMWGRFHSPVDTYIFGSLSFKNNQKYQPALVVNKETSHFFELDLPVRFNGSYVEIPASDFKDRFYLGKFDHIDSVNLIISKIPERMKFLRKLHEYSFDRLNRYKFGKKIIPAFTNVKYDRLKTGTHPEDFRSYHGVLETMKFA